MHESSSGPEGDTWLAITESEPPIDAAYRWTVQPDCGAVVLFSGTARDHSEGRPDVTQLAYEAYEEHLLGRFEGLVDEIRDRWPEVRRVCIMHRVGEVPIGESTVIVVASSPHRDVAFEAARYGIDRLKATAPVWKREVWAEGESWGLDAREIDEVGIGSPAPAAPLSADLGGSPSENTGVPRSSSADLGGSPSENTGVPRSSSADLGGSPSEL